MRNKSIYKSISSKHELSYSALPREPIQLSCSPILPSEQGEAIDEVLRSFGIVIPAEAFKALLAASKRSVAGSAFVMARAILSSLKDADSPDITPLKCLLLERMLGLNYLTFEEIAAKCGTSKQNAQTQLKWHESIGQACHYALVLRLKPCIALYRTSVLSPVQLDALKRLTARRRIDVIFISVQPAAR